MYKLFNDYDLHSTEGLNITTFEIPHIKTKVNLFYTKSSLL